jgi:hypothetical protein
MKDLYPSRRNAAGVTRRCAGAEVATLQLFILKASANF